MIDYETYRRIHHLHGSGELNVAQIARRIGADARTVRFWLQEEPVFRPRKRTPRPTIRCRPNTPHLVIGNMTAWHHCPSFRERNNLANPLPSLDIVLAAILTVQRNFPISHN